MIDTKVERSVSQSPRPHPKMVGAPPPPAVTPPTPARSPRRRRRVIKFNTTIHNRRIPHLNDMTDEEIAIKWIQPEEYLEIRRRCILTVKKMMSGRLTEIDLESGRHCPRGLEGKTRAGAAKRREHKLDSVAAVLEEQGMQWNEEVDDEEAIMEVYSVFSIPCAEESHLLGLEDAVEAAKYLMEPSPSVPPRPLVEDEDDELFDSELELSESIPEDDDEGRGDPSLVNKLKDIFSLRSSRAALLQDIEKTYFAEASIERNRRREESHSLHKQRDNPLVVQLREYFSLNNTQREEDSVADAQGQQAKECSPEECFTSQLHDIFHSRQRKQALLDEIENGYYKENRDSRKQETLSSVTLLSQSLGSKLKDIFYSKRSRAAVLNELGASNHMRQ